MRSTKSERERKKERERENNMEETTGKKVDLKFNLERGIKTVRR